MKKVLLALCLGLTLYGCGKESSSSEQAAVVESTEVIVSEAPSVTTAEATMISEDTVTNISETESSNTTVVDSDGTIQIIQTAFIYDDSSIDDYVAQMNDSDFYSYEYKVYDETHYCYYITEDERLEVLATFPSDDKSTIFSNILTTDYYAGAFIQIDCDSDMKEIQIITDQEILATLDENLAPSLVDSINLIADYYQAYSLVPLEDRVCHVIFIDSDTQEIIYDNLVDGQ